MCSCDCPGSGVGVPMMETIEGPKRWQTAVCVLPKWTAVVLGSVRAQETMEDRRTGNRCRYVTCGASLPDQRLTFHPALRTLHRK
jgi:hypothetical protein